MTSDSSHFADLIGRLSSNRNNAFEVTDDRGVRSLVNVPLIKQVSVSAPAASHGALGLVLGLLSGAVGTVIGRQGEPACRCGISALDVAVSGIMGTAIGSALGFGMGSNFTTEKWTAIAP